MWTNPLTIALVAAGSTLLTILLTPRLQHHFWKLQREEERRFWKLQCKDELRLEAIRDYNRLTNAYVAACLSQIDPHRPIEEWLRDLNATAATIRVLFSDRAYSAANEITRMITPYATWAVPIGERKARANEFSEVCDAALTALYSEVIE